MSRRLERIFKIRGDKFKNMSTSRYYTKMICKNCKKINLVMEDSRKYRLCNPCRERLLPNHIPLEQYDYYWRNWYEKQNH